MDEHNTQTDERTHLLDVEEPPHSSVNSQLSDISKSEAEESPNELLEPRKRRKPFHYSSIPTYMNNDGSQTPVDSHTAATYSRYRYYSRLQHPQDDTLAIPDHVLPSYIFTVTVPFVSSVRDREGKQSSIVTIFSIWNTMMGTSLLSMPWAIHQAGFAVGIFLLISMAGLTLYTCYRVVESVSKEAGSAGRIEFSDVCKSHLGKWGEIISIIFSLVALLGAVIVYWVLMSNFLYSTVSFIYGEIGNTIHTAPNDTAVLCSLDWTTISGFEDNGTTPWESVMNISQPVNHDIFHEVWNETGTVPFFLLLLVVPLINFKSPTFFTKFNALGTLSVAFLVTFVIIKASEWGFNLNFEDPADQSYIKLFSWTFPAFSGLLSLSYFIHNAVSSIMRAQRHPEHNGRDMTIAYILVACTYTFVGLVFYMTFPEPKECIKDNLLDNFYPGDTLAFAARLCLLFQMITLFPLIVYIIRVQVFDPMFNSAYPSVKHVIILNVLLLTLSVLFAVFLPSIGVIIRFSGAFCGLAYIFTLPCLIYMMDLHKQGKLRWYHVAIHSVIMVLGVINLLAQFVILFIDK